MLSLDALYSFPLFGGLDAEALAALSAAGEIVTAEPDEWLFEEGEVADAFYIVLSGAIELRMAINADRIDLADLERVITGEVVGWSALIRPYRYTLSAVAVEDTRLLKLDAARVRALMERDPVVGYKLMGQMAETVRQRLTAMHTRFVSLIAV